MAKKDKGDKPKHSAELKAHATEVLNGIATQLHDLAQSFGAEGHGPCQEYWEKQAQVTLKRAGWYDEAAAARAKKERLEAQLAELEAEIEAAEEVAAESS